MLKSAIALLFTLNFLLISCDKSKDDLVTLEHLNSVQAQIASCTTNLDCTSSVQSCSCQPLAHNKQSDITEYLSLQERYRKQNATPCPQCAAVEYTSECRAGKCEAIPSSR